MDTRVLRLQQVQDQFRFATVEAGIGRDKLVRSQLFDHAGRHCVAGQLLLENEILETIEESPDRSCDKSGPAAKAEIDADGLLILEPAGADLVRARAAVRPVGKKFL